MKNEVEKIDFGIKLKHFATTLGPEDFSRGGSDTGKYSAGTGGIHHTGTGGFSDSRKGRAFGTEAE